jgi:hypothetical protein
MLKEWFYDFLLKGESTNGALRKAKLRFLSPTDPKLAAPYYWAGFMLMGNGAQLSQPLVAKPTPFHFLGFSVMELIYITLAMAILGFTPLMIFKLHKVRLSINNPQ